MAQTMSAFGAGKNMGPTEEKPTLQAGAPHVARQSLQFLNWFRMPAASDRKNSRKAADLKARSALRIALDLGPAPPRRVERRTLGPTKSRYIPRFVSARSACSAEEHLPVLANTTCVFHSTDPNRFTSSGASVVRTGPFPWT